MHCHNHLPFKNVHALVWLISTFLSKPTNIHSFASTSFPQNTKTTSLKSVNSATTGRIPLITDEGGMDRQIILPGETRTIYMDDESCVAKIIEEEVISSNGNLKVAVGVTGKTTEEYDDLLEMASLCNIHCYNGHLVTVECIGRVKLHNCIQLSPYCKFSFSEFEDDYGCLEKCRLVADNIEIFIKKFSTFDNHEDSLLHKYNCAYEQCYKINTSNDERIKSLTSLSWAVFIAIDEQDSNTMNLYNYRVRALDYDTLFDRLKLAQYMLREKELRLYGQKMIDDKELIDDELVEGFQ